jgi:hypothetical protein
MRDAEDIVQSMVTNDFKAESRFSCTALYMPAPACLVEQQAIPVQSSLPINFESALIEDCAIATLP